tara:strand:+ start:552 stop:671 length:120 start_codon:yes stop_codon:yes gene_type:complete
LKEFLAAPLEYAAMSLLWLNSLIFNVEYEVSKYDEDEQT